MSMMVHTLLILALALIVIPTPLVKQIALSYSGPREKPVVLDPVLPKFEPPKIEEIRQAIASNASASASLAELPTRPLDIPGGTDLPEPA